MGISLTNKVLRGSGAIIVAAATVGLAASAIVTAAVVPASITDEIASTFRSQARDGALVLDGSERFFADYPVLATLCLAACEEQPNAALISQTVSALGRYYAFLFSARDRDHNLLVETTLAGLGGEALTVEDVGYNALVALDMLSLARLHVQIKRPYDALYWYEGARTVQEALIQSSFDTQTGYFFPYAPERGASLGHHYALSSLPLLFAADVGDNHAGRVVRSAFLDPQARFPESPYDYLAGPTRTEEDDVSASARTFKTLLMLDVLRARGFEVEARAFRTPAAERAHKALAALSASGTPTSAHHRFFVARLTDEDAPLFYDPLAALDVFEAVVRAARNLEDPEIVRLGSSVAELRRFERATVAGTAVQSDVKQAETAVRTIYGAVSKARDDLDAKQLFPSDAYRSTRGLDPVPAMGRLLDDVTTALQRTENRIFERRDRGPRLVASAALSGDTAILGAGIGVAWTLSAPETPVTIASASMVVGDQVFALVDDARGLTVEPGTPARLASEIYLDRGHTATLVPLTITLDVDDGSGTHARYHAHRSVYLEQPVAVTAAFPRGRMLTGTTVPIDVTMVKKARVVMTIRYDWYSPTGLGPAEGRSAEYTMDADNDSTTLRLNINIPSPCRPGRFPFKLKFYGNETDLGTISSSLFKPYRWAFAGPFGNAADALSKPYPPERRIDLLATYEGAAGRVGWKVLSETSHTPQGDVSLSRVLTAREPVVGFLYTAIEAPEATTSPVFLGANASAALYVNGDLVMRTDPTHAGSPAYARVDLQRGLNNILIKLIGNRATHVYFNLGDENDDSSYGFDNNMAAIVDGFTALERRNRGEVDAPQDFQKLVTLHYRDPEANAVSVIGTFNGWSPDQSRMTRLKNGVWEIVLSLPPGKHAYRFLVDNRKQVVDPSSTTVEPDGFGGKNSILYVE